MTRAEARSRKWSDEELKLSLLTRFHRNVRAGADDACWEWQGQRHSFGHGTIASGGAEFGGRRVLAHRLAWELANGRPVPDGMCVLHRCDNPPCCNPAHLFLGTDADNVADMMRKGRHSVANRATGARNGRARLSWDMVRSARARHASGESARAIARSLGVAPATIDKIVHGKAWRA